MSALDQAKALVGMIERINLPDPELRMLHKANSALATRQQLKRLIVQAANDEEKQAIIALEDEIVKNYIVINGRQARK